MALTSQLPLVRSISNRSELLTMNSAEFLRQYEVRAPNIMWLLGAGASAAAGVPTAFHMIWDFKRTLYCSAQKIPISACEDLSSPNVRGRLQNYFDATRKF